MDEAVRALMVQRAQIQVRAAWEAHHVLMDFTPESLARLDALIDEDVAKPPLDADELSEVIGAYLGEVLVRRQGAEWAGTREVPRLLACGQAVDPLAVAKARVTGDAPTRLAVFYGDLTGQPVPDPEPPQTPPGKPKEPGTLLKLRRLFGGDGT